jgi:arginyl-tRNA---protein transferase
MYRVDGELIAMGVLDILPGCVSSVYFIYDKAWEKFSLGKVTIKWLFNCTLRLFLTDYAYR